MLDVVSTLLELGGYDIPTSMQGKSLVVGKYDGDGEKGAASPKGEAIIHDRLSGLGYIS